MRGLRVEKIASGVPGMVDITGSGKRAGTKNNACKIHSRMHTYTCTHLVCDASADCPSLHVRRQVADGSIATGVLGCGEREGGKEGEEEEKKEG